MYSLSIENHVWSVWCRLTVDVCFQESKWTLFKRKLKPGTTFENPSYSEVNLDNFKTKKQKEQLLFTLVYPVCCSTDEGRKACRKQRGPFSPRALSICTHRQTSEEGSSGHLFANRRQFQRHSQPCERGQRRITLSHGNRRKKKRNTLCTEFIFLCSLCTKLKLREKYISIEWREKGLLWLCLLTFLMPILMLMFSLFWCTICISLHWSCW